MTVTLTENHDNSLTTSTPTATGASLASAASRKLQTHNADYLAHDARNWLTVLQVYCDLLRTSGAVASGYQKWIDELSGAVERGHDLVISLLDSVHQSGHADGQAAELVAPSLDVADAITRRLPLLKSLAGTNIQVKVDVPTDAANAALAESAFERILQNLVSNAIEAMPDGGCLQVTLRREGRERDEKQRAGQRPGRTTSKNSVPKSLLLRVSDTGNGIAPEHVTHIFEAGVSGKATGKNNGRRGFGLAIVRELTQSAGGTVRVRSHPGQGSCFEVELPQV